MKYKFIGGIYTEGVRAFIKIPFNVWEEICRLTMRETISGLNRG